MPFDHGSFTVSIFEMPKPLEEDAISRFAARRAGMVDDAKSDPELGWVTGRHVLETGIDDGNAWRGGCLYLNLRKTQRKISSVYLNAICQRDELAYMQANQTEMVPRAERKRIREAASELLLPKMTPSIAALPMVLDPAAGLLYVGSTSVTQLDEFIQAFVKTTGIEPAPWNIDRMLERRFKVGLPALPALTLTDRSAGEFEPGRDFLTWLWYDNESGGGVELSQYGKFEIMIEGPFVLVGESDANGAGETSLKKGDCPLRSAEAKAALSVGKKLRKAKFNLVRDNQIWSGTFDADRFAISALKLPEGDEMEREAHFAERMQNLLIFKEAFEAFFCRYAGALLEGNPEELFGKLRHWAAERDSL